MGPFDKASPVDQPVQIGLHGSHPVHCLLEREETVLADWLGQNFGRVIEGGEQIKVGSGV